MKTKLIALILKKEIWNNAVIATLREVRKYDGLLSKEDREYMTKQISNKVGKKLNHNFKPLSYCLALILIISSYTTNAQLQRDEDRVNYPVVGFHLGYDIKISAPVAGLQFGYKAGNIFTSVNTLIPVTSNALAPKMVIGNVGYNIGAWQPFVSYGYHFIGKVTEAYFSHTVDAYKSGFHFGLGVSYYPMKFPLCFTVQKQGKEIISSLTLYKAL